MNPDEMATRLRLRCYETVKTIVVLIPFVIKQEREFGSVVASPLFLWDDLLGELLLP